MKNRIFPPDLSQKMSARFQPDRATNKQESFNRRLFIIHLYPTMPPISHFG